VGWSLLAAGCPVAPEQPFDDTRTEPGDIEHGFWLDPVTGRGWPKRLGGYARRRQKLARAARRILAALSGHLEPGQVLDEPGSAWLFPVADSGQPALGSAPCAH
jgi:hypothetical protein